MTEASAGGRASASWKVITGIPSVTGTSRWRMRMETKLTRKERSHRYYEKHKEELNEKNRRYRLEHREALNAYRRERYQQMKLRRLMELIGEKANEAD